MIDDGSIEAGPASLLKVIIITPPLNASGGIGRLTSYLQAALAEKNVVATVLDSRGASPTPWLSICAVSVATARLIITRFRRRGPDVVHVNVATRGSVVRKCWFILVVKALRLPLVIQLHSGLFPGFYASLCPLVQRLISAIFRQADAVLVLSQCWADYSREVLRIERSRIHVAPCGVPGPPRTWDRSSAQCEKPFSVLFLGRLGKAKGAPTLVSALARLEAERVDWRAVIAGDGNASGLLSVAGSKNIAHKIDFPGWVESALVPQLLAQADVLVLPSEAEGLPVAVLEAFAWGLPVVATAVGSLSDILDSGVNGLVVPPNDDKSLAAALVTLARDPTLRSRLGACAQRCWALNYSVDKCTANLVTIWSGVARKCSPSLPSAI